MIRLAAANCSLPHLGAHEAAEAFRSCGFKLLELQAVPGFTFSLDDFEPMALASSLGLDVIALYPQPLDVHTPERLETSMGYLRRCAPHLEAFGCGLVVFTPMLPREGFSFSALASALRMALEVPGVQRIAVENHAGWPVSDPDDFAQLFELVDDPRVGMTVDSGHFSAVGVNAADVVRRFPDRLLHVHLKDQIGSRCVPFGTGETPNLALVELLREIGYDGFATLEVEMPESQDPVGELRRSVETAVHSLGLSL